MGSLPRDAQGRVIFEKLGDATEEGDDFAPESREQLELREASSQSEELTSRSVGSQARFFEEAASQTSAEDQQASPSEPLSVSSRAMREMESSLRSNESSRALQGYSVSWEEKSRQTVLLYTLCCHPLSVLSSSRPQPSSSSPRSAADASSVLSLSWNSSGNLLAAAYGSVTPLGTDTRESSMAVWNLSRTMLRQEEADEVLVASSSVTALQFHPRYPGLLLYGTSSGEVGGYDLGRKESVRVHGASDMHRESVSGLEWTYDSLPGDFHLLSSSLEGKLVLWRLRDREDVELWPLVSFSPGPDGIGAQRVRAGGLTCMRRETTGGFLLGTEAGGVFRCFLDYSKIHNMLKAKAGTAADTFSNPYASSKVQVTSMEYPISYSLHPHVGPVTSVAASPLRSNLFASAAADGIIRIHFSRASLQAAPLLVLEPSVLSVYCIAWSPAKPLVLAAGGSGGLVFLYDLAVDPSNPVETLRATRGGEGEGWDEDSELRAMGSNVNALQFQDKGSLLAAGCWSGETFVWRLKSELSEQAPGDEGALDKLLG